MNMLTLSKNKKHENVNKKKTHMNMLKHCEILSAKLNVLFGLYFDHEFIII